MENVPDPFSSHALPKEELNSLVQDYYLPYFGKLQELTNVPFEASTYTDIQGNPVFRKQFLATLKYVDLIGWCVGPATGTLRVRIPCPKCHYAEKYADRTELVKLNDDEAVFRCMCLNHGSYEVLVTEENREIYLDLNTLYRNLVKEMVCATHKDKLYVMVKGGDWAFSTQPVDWALGVLGYTSVQVPMRIFTPQIVTETGAKLSKSLIRDGDTSLEEVPEWILDMGKFEKHNPDYVDYIVWLVELFLSHPRHMYRSYSYQEIIRIFKQKK